MMARVGEVDPLILCMHLFTITDYFFVVFFFLTTNCQVCLQVNENIFTATRAAFIGNVKSFILIIRFILMIK